jgi:hypothetical protein
MAMKAIHAPAAIAAAQYVGSCNPADRLFSVRNDSVREAKE